MAFMHTHDKGAKNAVRHARDWRRIHHSPVFWIGLGLCLAAIATYVLTEDLSLRPRIHRAGVQSIAAGNSHL